MNLFQKYNSKAWVNCINRSLPAYQDLKSKIKGNGTIIINVEGGDWEIGGNCIHYLDLFNFLTDEEISDFNIDYLDKKINQSKRDGFIDFNGQIHVETLSGNKLNLINDKTSDRPVVISIVSNNYRYIIFEHISKAIIQSIQNNWDWAEIPFPIIPQSKLTNIIVEDIFSNGECKLSTIEQSYHLHKPMLNSFTKLYKQINNDNYNNCPIT